MARNLLIIFILLFLSSCADLHTFKTEQEASLMQSYGFGAKQRIAFQLPANWKQGLADSRGTSIQRAYIPQDESMSSWTQAIFDIYQPNIDMNQVFRDSESGIRNICQQPVIKVLTHTARMIVFTASGKNCDGDADRYAYVKIFQGIDGVYSLQYFAIPGKVPSPATQQGISIIESSYLTKKSQ